MTGERTGRARLIAAVLTVLTVVLGGQSVAQAAEPPPIASNADWLTTVNYYRAMAGLAPVSEEPSWSLGALHHSQYTLRNGVLTHDEVNGAPGWTADGDAAAASGNVAAHSDPNTTDRTHIEQWLAGPFHAIGVLRPQLTRTGYGHATDTGAAPYRSAATLDVLRGIDRNVPRPIAPVVFPGDGTSTHLDRLAAETPDPRTFCGWGGASVGLPLIAMFPSATGGASSSLTGPNGPVTTCTLAAGNLSGVARSIVEGENAVIVMPAGVLTPGIYRATVSTASAGSVSWSFTIDPAVADGTAYSQPLSSTVATAGAAGFDPVTPVRVVDTRQSIGARRLTANTVTRLQIAGRSGLAADATSIAANLTIVNAAGTGFLTVFPCNGATPVVSSVNFTAGRPVPNSAAVPLDATGGMCAVSSVAADLIVDVNGVFRSTGATRFTPLNPVRLLDTRTGAGGSGRLAAGQTIELPIRGTGGVPANATAVAVNLTAVGTAGEGYVTAYPCGALPVASNINVVNGETRPNLVTAALSARGSICLFSSVAVDLLVDVAGAFVPASGRRFTPLQPMRLLDTRSLDSRLNAGTYGVRMRAGQVVDLAVSGVRGIPTGAAAASLNITSTGSDRTGFLTVYPCGARPDASNANYAGQDVANAVQATLDGRGHVCIYSEAPTWLIVDINGVWS